MTAFFESNVAPGISISIGVGDSIVWSKGYGFADLEQKVPVDPEVTKFRVGSVAKPITGAALGCLIEQEKIKLDADVRKYLPDFPKKEHSFTVRQLAGHLAGIRHYKNNEAYISEHYDTVTQALQIFKDDPLVSAPGEEWNYSSYGFNLLSAVMEAASKKGFLKLVEECVFNPLDMKNTVADDVREVIPGRGRYYFIKEGKIFNEPVVDNSYKWASGGFLSTTNDIVKFGLAHINATFLSRETIDLLWEEQKTNDGNDTGYGMGWRIVMDDDKQMWIGHGGGAIGGTSQFWIFPEEKVVIAISSNLTELNYGDVLVKLRRVFSK